MTEYEVPDLGAQPDGDEVENGLRDFFELEDDSDWVDMVLIKREFESRLVEAQKSLIGDHSSEKAGTIGVHGFHGFDNAMKAAFPGWPEDTDSYYKFRGQVFFRQGGGVILGNKKVVTDAYDRFVNAIWGKPIPENRFWPVLKTLTEGVKYCRGDYADRKYRVTIGPVITRRGEVFDSQTLYDRKIKGRYPTGGVAPSNDSMKCRCIWVMSVEDGGDATFYTHIGKLGRFHHSSFKAGGAITAAGEWVIANGKLTHINACSGHYKPEPWRFMLACLHLKNRGAITGETLLEVWRNGTDRELVPCLPFLNRFSANLQSGYQLYRS